MDARDPPQLVGRYAIYGMIASGGMATVHFGRFIGAAGFTRTVAVKRLHPHLASNPEFRSTMIDEARLAARIHHPNVVPTLDIVAANGELLLVMEYVRGESLGRLVAADWGRGQRVPLRIASAIVVGVLHGLHAAHEATSEHGTPLGIVHRDISPQNILVGEDGIARLIDFGVAKAVGRLQTTSDGAIKGKIAYMAPEQLAAGDARLATGEVTRAADVYAVGALFWELLAGRRLFPGESDARRAMQVLMGASDPPSRYAPDLPPLLDRIVMRALALDPADRFASALEMAETLLDVVPPTFSTDVGKWVSDVARDALGRRGAELAKIESLSDATILSAGPLGELDGERTAPSRRSLRVATPSVFDVQTVSAQPSTLSVEPPRSAPAESKPRQTGKAAAALGGAVLVAVGVAMFVARGGVPHQPGGPPASVAAQPEASLEPVPAAVSASPPGSVSSAAADAAPSSMPPRLPVPPVPPRPHVRGRPAPKQGAPFRFTQPD